MTGVPTGPAKSADCGGVGRLCRVRSRNSMGQILALEWFDDGCRTGFLAEFFAEIDCGPAASRDGRLADSLRSAQILPLTA